MVCAQLTMACTWSEVSVARLGQAAVVPPGERRLTQTSRAMCPGRHTPRLGSGRTSECRATRHSGGRPPDRVTMAGRGCCCATGDHAWAWRALLAASSTLG